MSEAMLDRLEQRVMQQGMQKGIQKGIQQGMQQGIQQGMQQGIQKGEDRAFALIDLLLTQNRLNDIKRIQTDLAYRQQLMHELLPEQC